MANSKYVQYVLDTNILRPLLNEGSTAHGVVRSHFDTVYKDCIWVSVVVIVEGIKGAANSVNDSDPPSVAALKYDLFLKLFRRLCGFQILEYRTEYAQELQNLTRPAGAKPVGARDRRIASIAMALGYTIVTSNVKDFLALGVPSEFLTDWTVEPDFHLDESG